MDELKTFSASNNTNVGSKCWRFFYLPFPLQCCLWLWWSKSVDLKLEFDPKRPSPLRSKSRLKRLAITTMKVSSSRVTFYLPFVPPYTDSLANLSLSLFTLTLAFLPLFHPSPLTNSYSPLPPSSVSLLFSLLPKHFIFCFL